MRFKTAPTMGAVSFVQGVKRKTDAATQTSKRKRHPRKQHRHIRAVDVGGTHVKVMLSPLVGKTGIQVRAKADRQAHGREGHKSDRWTGPTTSCRSVIPGPVANNRPLTGRPISGTGWMGFNFQRRWPSGQARQRRGDRALGSYAGGRMLFLGLGTGLGSAMIMEV